jgi:hypothetical protein
MIFNLEPNEAAYIVRLIGSQPTESGAYPLHQKLVAQFQSQSDEGKEQAQAEKEAMKPGEPE